MAEQAHKEPSSSRGLENGPVLLSSIFASNGCAYC
ncbi:hypothetical protein ACP70R_015752 [Stipagrostis hirtigluma subsp. patula]